MIGRLRKDEQGATIVEFALVAPVALLMLLGMFDMAHNLYTATVMNGAIQKAARDSSIEGASREALDARVAREVRKIAPDSTLAFGRKNYSNFSDARNPEDFTDLNSDGRCNDGEPFEDSNGNGRWDDDRGADGIGGARDAVLYSVNVTYPRLFPVEAVIGLPDEIDLTVETVLRNQPWNTQSRPAPGSGNCT